MGENSTPVDFFGQTWEVDKNGLIIAYDIDGNLIGAEGIHHVFREIHGGWTRTYADYQLIGKIVKEVEYGNP